jgi:membrane associated rhomboid family serine protease
MQNNLWNDFKMQVVWQDNWLNRLLALNIIIFVFFQLVKIGILLSGNDAIVYGRIEEWLAMPASLGRFITRPWTIITYQFMHSGIWHLVFNMIVFLTAGRIFREFQGDKKLLAMYLMGGVAGAVAFVAAYNIFPFFSRDALAMHASLVGASAAIIAVLVAAATLVPTYTINLILIGPVKLVYVALTLFILSVLSLAGGNAGGEFAHVGGAIYGFAYIKALRNGYDINRWLVNIIERLSGGRKPKTAVKLNYVNKKGEKKARPGSVSEDEVDRILDKISKSGYDSLTAQEKEVLFKASNQK